MGRAPKITGLIFVMSLVCFALVFHFAAQRSAQTAKLTAVPAASCASPADASPAAEALPVLFPDLVVEDIVYLSVRTPDRSFEFRLGEHGRFLVNNQSADMGIYNTLVSQIARIPVSAVHAIPEENTQLLTLQISTPAHSHVAHFFADGGADTEAFIRSGPREAPLYFQTDAWRVGTLIMACEGAPIHEDDAPLP